MKKAIAILILFVIFIVIYFLQLNLFSWFTIAGVKPNIFRRNRLFRWIFGEKPIKR